MKVNIRYNGNPPDEVVAEFAPRTAGGLGGRDVILAGWGRTEERAREQLLSQAKAARDELNIAIEHMIEQLIDIRRDR